MTLEDIRRQFSKPPAEYPKSVDNPDNPCPWCGKLVEYRYLEAKFHQPPSGWKCSNCKREGYFSVKYQFDPLESPRGIPIAEGDSCHQCGNPVRNIWADGTPAMGGHEWWCQHCRAQGRYQEIPF